MSLVERAFQCKIFHTVSSMAADVDWKPYLDIVQQMRRFRLNEQMHRKSRINGMSRRAARVARVALTFPIMLLLAVFAPGRAQAQTFTTIDVPGAGTAAFEGTIPIGINAAGTITGLYLITGNVAHGFVRAPGGKITAFGAKGAGTASNQGTFPVAINTARTKPW